MSRPRSHSNNADRQAAYRARLKDSTTRVDRAAMDQFHLQLEALQDAVHSAAVLGHPLALACRAASIGTLLDKLTAEFNKMNSVDERPMK